MATLDGVAKKGAMFKSLADSWADTTMGATLLRVLGGLAEFQRDLIRVRTGADR
jgi:DNA invertase Pin-like site-specific DNA recombinase